MSLSFIYPRARRAGICFVVLSVLSISLTLRRAQNSDWLLKAPAEVGAWTAAETPLPGNFVSRIASPKNQGFEFVNPLDERIVCQFIAPQSFESYREPEPFSNLQISAQRQLPLFSRDKALRAWILKMPGNDTRVLVYTWLQTPSGKVSVFGDRKMEPSLLDRLLLSLRAITQTEPQCLVRLYCFIPPSDKNGVQSRRNLDRVAQAIYTLNTEKPSP